MVRKVKRISAGEQWAYSVIEAASLLSLSRAKMYQMMAAGELASFKAGKRRLIAAEALRAWLVNAQEAA